MPTRIYPHMCTKLSLIFSSVGCTLHGLGERWESLVPFVQLLIRLNPIGPKLAQERWSGFTPLGPVR